MKKLHKILAPLFLLIELGLYIIILFFYDTLPKPDFISIVLAAAFAFCFFKPTMPNLLLNAGLVATVCADTFLVLLSPLNYNKQVAGVVFFSITQLCYFAYLLKAEERIQVRKIHILIRILAVMVAELAMLLVLKENTDTLSVISLFYIANLAVNGIFAYTQGKKHLLFAIGLTLFLCCDLFVGFSAAIGTYLPISESSLFYKIIFSDFNFIWFFYLPSQVCIAIYTMKRSIREI